ncbi:MAG: CoA transferase [Pseudomonadota bacterium]|nr:CoA transferase [Pseudomonadota bacterium]
MMHNKEPDFSSEAPLHGLRVLDIATFVAAPFAGACLAEFGAEVIKIEKPVIGDSLRTLGGRSEAGDSYFWINEARNKKCVTLDLKIDKGADLFRRMVENSDVVIENFRPGTLERWGLGYDELKAINPGLIMLRVSAYGQTGPKRDLPGFARIAQAFAGLTYLVGQPDTPPLIAGSTTLADYLSGLYGAYGVLLALRARDRNGEGQFIDIALHDGIFRFLDEIAAVYDKTGEIRERMGTETHTSVPHSHYPTSDGKWVAIACTNDKMFARLASVLGRPELATAEQFGTVKTRLAGRTEVNRLVGEWTEQRSRDEVIKLCSDGDVPCGPVNSIADIFNEPQYWERDTLVRVADDRIGELTVQGVVPTLSATPGKIVHLGAALGEHNEAIYKTWLGLSDEQLTELKRAQVI